jgi:hypothetical protein
VSCVRAPILLGASIWIAALSGCGGGAKDPGGRPAASAAATGPSSSATASAPAQSQASTATAPGGSTPTASSETPAIGGKPGVRPVVAAQAGAICARRNRELRAVTQPRATLGQIAASAPRRAAIERRALRELARLVPPANVATYWRATVNASEVVLGTTEQLARLKGSSSAASLRREVALVNRPQLRLLLAARRAGLGECSVVARPLLPGLGASVHRDRTEKVVR